MVSPNQRGVDAGLEGLLARLKVLALGPVFRGQSDLAMGLVLRPYAEYAPQAGLYPLPEEVEQGNLYVFADYFPEDGQLSLIEQVRDTIEVHVPEEERAWLDPLKHSYIDLLEVVETEGRDTGDQWLHLRSLGNAKICRFLQSDVDWRVRAGQVLLGRVIHLDDRIVFPGKPLILSPGNGRGIFDLARQWQRQREVEFGSFELGEWEEFVKRYGYVLLWMYARARLEALAKLEAGIEYATPSGAPFLYALALYDHHAFRQIAEGLNAAPSFRAAASPYPKELLAWNQTNGAPGAVTTITLAPSHLIIECDSPARLDSLKHYLASTFGFLLHFIGESMTVPQHELPLPQLDEDTLPKIRVTVHREEERGLIAAFLDSVYLEWADRPCPSLRGMSPRHAAAQPECRDGVAALIDERERHDLALRRTGALAYDYNVLRRHVGLAEVQA
jgi:hypothetical protein